MDLPEAQGSRHARESKSGIPEIVLPVEFGILENFDGGIRDPGLSNPESMAWNPESGTVLNSLI